MMAKKERTLDIRFRFGKGRCFEIMRMPVTKMVNGYRKLRKYTLGSRFRFPGQSTQPWTVVGVGSEGGQITVDIR